MNAWGFILTLHFRRATPSTTDLTQIGTKAEQCAAAAMCGTLSPPPTGGSPAAGSATPDSTTLTHPTRRPVLRAFVPNTSLCTTAFNLVEAVLPLPILHHSVRVFLFAKGLAETEQSPWAAGFKLEVLFVACVCHDLGTSNQYNGPQRFEVEGADAAVQLLRSHKVSSSDMHEVWTAIALHTSPGIAERISPLARLVRLGVLIDFRQATREALGATEYARDIEKKIPRLDVEKVLGDVVVGQALQNREKAPPASWPGILLKAHLEDPKRDGVNPAF